MCSASGDLTVKMGKLTAHESVPRRERGWRVIAGPGGHPRGSGTLVALKDRKGEGLLWKCYLGFVNASSSVSLFFMSTTLRCGRAYPHFTDEHTAAWTLERKWLD